MQRRNRKSRISMDCTFRTLMVLTAALLMLLPMELRAQEDATQSEEQKLIGVLKSDATLFDKAKACQRLAVIGGKDAVPALAKLLGDKGLAHYARFGLEPNPDPSVDAALMEAMAKLKGDLRIGVINSIGARRNAGALDALAALIDDADKSVAAAAASAVGRIGTPKAAETLKEALADSTGDVRTAIAAACLPCAEALLAGGEKKAAVRTYLTARRAKKIPQHLKQAALRGLLLARGAQGLRILVKTLKGKSEPSFNTALIAVREVPGTDVTQGIVAALGELSTARQAKLIGVLGERADRAALPAVLKAARSGAADVRLAAIGTLKTLGDASAVPVLIEVAAQSDEQAAALAQSTLAKLPGKEIDDALLAKLAHGGDAKLRPAVLEAVGQRRIRSAIPTLRKAALESSGQIRLAAISALGQTVTLEELPILTSALGKAGTPEEKKAVLDALHAAAGRMPDRAACTAKLVHAMSGAAVDERCLLLEVFTSVGGASALKAVSASAKDSNDRIRAAATNVLGNWQSEKASYALLSLVKTSNDSEDRLGALRAFSALVRRLGFPKEERIGVCKQAMELSRSDDERKVVLHTLAGIPAPETLALLATYLADPGLREAASQAALTIADRIVRTRRGAVTRSMKQILKATENEDTRKRAESLLKQAGEKR